MHILAYCYHWSRDSIWDLTINERKMWVNIVQMQKKAENNELDKDDFNSKPTYKES